MHKLFGLAPLVLLAACELQPAPPRQAAAPPPEPMPQPIREKETAPADAGVAPRAGKPPIEVTEQCLQVGVHVASVVIASADATQRTVFEQERERIVRGTAEVCTTQKWSDAASKCYLAAGTQTQIKACERKFPPPAPAAVPGATPPGPPQGAAPSRALEDMDRRPAGAAGGSAAPPRPPRRPRGTVGAGSGAPPR